MKIMGSLEVQGSQLQHFKINQSRIATLKIGDRSQPNEWHWRREFIFEHSKKENILLDAFVNKLHIKDPTNIVLSLSLVVNFKVPMVKIKQHINNLSTDFEVPISVIIREWIRSIKLGNLKALKHKSHEKTATKQHALHQLLHTWC